MNVPSWTEFWLLQIVGQTSLCLMLGLCLALRFIRRPARAHSVLVLALAAAVAAPFASQAIKRVNGGLLPGSAPPTEFRVADRTLDDTGAVGKSGPVTWFLAIWCVGTCALLTGIGLSYWRGRRLIAQTIPVTDGRLQEALEAARAAVGLRTSPELRSHDCIGSPMVWAWSRRPIALIGEDCVCSTDDIDWESIFIHELAHVERRDHVAALCADVAVALFWWNPLAWLLRRELDRQSEFACDDRVAGTGKSPVEYASSLLSLRREALLPRIPATNLEGNRHWLKTRVSRLLQIDAPPAIRSGPVWSTAAFMLTVLVVLILALTQTRTMPRPENSFAAPLTSLCASDAENSI